MSIGLNWTEELGNDCPPPEAEYTNSTYFRLGENPPREEDFFSHRKLNPSKVYPVPECQSKSLSVFNTLDAVTALVNTSPTLRNKKIIQVNLTPQDGVIQKTGRNPNHYSWWRSTNFDVNNVIVVNS